MELRHTTDTDEKKKKTPIDEPFRSREAVRVAALAPMCQTFFFRKGGAPSRDGLVEPVARIMAPAPKTRTPNNNQGDQKAPKKTTQETKRHRKTKKRTKLGILGGERAHVHTRGQMGTGQIQCNGGLDCALAKTRRDRDRKQRARTHFGQLRQAFSRCRALHGGECRLSPQQAALVGISQI